MRSFDRWQRAGFYDRGEPMLLLFVQDPSMPSGEWKTIGNVVLAHCGSCFHQAIHALATDPPSIWDDVTEVAPPPVPQADRFRRRADGWPLCPSCGEDELWSAFIPWTAAEKTMANYLALELRCYRCPNVVIPPGAALPPGAGR